MSNNLDEFRSGFSKVYDKFESADGFGLLFESSTVSLTQDSLSLVSTNQEYIMQKPIREWFGKEGVNQKPIGAHPDFKHLSKTAGVEYHYITTMFVDIKNSTRLALLYDLKTVMHIKNTILRYASEIVRALDGHVHRFMGDALMAYFGGKNQSPEDATMAALSCAAMLQVVMKEVVIPDLKRRNIDPSYIGFRVGIDFGGSNDVLWSSYGYTGVHEVTATSLYVDRASKLQSMASKDSVMLGSNLIKFLDLSDNFTQIKTKIRNGNLEEIKYLTPNLTDKDGVSCDYKIMQLDSDKFYALLPLPIELKTILAPSLIINRLKEINFHANVKEDEEGNDWKYYPSLSRCISKDNRVRFLVMIPKHALDGLRLPLKGRFIKQNYGVEAANDNSIKEDIEPFEISSNSKDFRHSFQRNTAYRGLHTVTLEIIDYNNKPIFRNIIGVHIE